MNRALESFLLEPPATPPRPISDEVLPAWTPGKDFSSYLSGLNDSPWKAVAMFINGRPERSWDCPS